MAITKKINFKWFDTNAYAKLRIKEIFDYLVDWVKNYDVLVEMLKFTNSTKQYTIEWTTEKVKWLLEKEITFKNLYTKVIEMKNWDGWVSDEI